MLTRLKIQGFKNIVDANIKFGPFTCIAGKNGVGKSNLFDAIMFLRDLTEYSVIDAATRVRDPHGKTGDLRALFTQTQEGISPKLSFEADILVPQEIKDDFGRITQPKATFLNYRIELEYIEADHNNNESIKISSERLTYIRKRDSKRRIGFARKKEFLGSVVQGEKRSDFISTEIENGIQIIKLHQDSGGGPPSRFPAKDLPRTILGGINSFEYPTALAARREIQSWLQLQLEPSALRKPDNFYAEGNVTETGEHLPSTLLRLGEYEEVANNLSELVDVSSVYVDEDQSRRLRTLMVKGRDGVSHPARSLSDGTLRFLALSIINADKNSGRLICLEEPENGIHPSKIKSIIEILQKICVDPDYAVDEDNPLRQVIINTHSPSVVSNLPEDALIFARPLISTEGTFTTFQCLEETWRALGPHNKEEQDTLMSPAPKGELMAYITDTPLITKIEHKAQKTNNNHKVIDFAQRQGILEFS